MTEARLDANRRNAKKSTGPRTGAGKARSRMNGFRHGMRSSEYLRLLIALSDAKPGAVLRAEQSLLTAAQRTHPAYVELVELFIEVERQMVEPSYPFGRAVRKNRRKKHDERSLKVIYNQ
jgi:hypothetical protein